MAKKRRRPALHLSCKPKPVKNPLVQGKASMTTWEFLRKIEKMKGGTRRGIDPIL